MRIYINYIIGVPPNYTTKRVGRDRSFVRIRKPFYLFLFYHKPI